MQSNEEIVDALKKAIAESKIRGYEVYDSKVLVLKVEAIISQLEDAR